MRRVATGLMMAWIGVGAFVGCDDKAGGATSTAAASASGKATTAATATASAAADTKMSGEEMAKAAHKAGRPLVPDDWKPAADVKVIKEISDSGLFDMYTVTRVAGDKAYVKFCGSGDEHKEPEAVDSLAPVPAKDNKDLPAAGDYVVIPEKNAQSCKWQFAKVKMLHGKNLMVETVNFQKRQEKTKVEERMVRAGEFVLVK